MRAPDSHPDVRPGAHTCRFSYSAMTSLSTRENEPCSKASSGEIHFAEGQIVHAKWDAIQGDDAFYKMLTLHEGDFRLDPAYKPSATRSIQASPEALLLEGMRRLDEGKF